MKTHKIISKGLALCLTLLMAVGMISLGVAADVEPNSTASIIVTGAETDQDLKVSVYQLMTVKVNDNGQPQEPVYTWMGEVAGWIRDKYRNHVGDDDDSYIGSANDNSVKAGFSTAKAEEIAAFYDALAAAIRGGSIPLDAAKTATTTEGVASITGLGMGNYLVLIEDGMSIYSPSAVNLIPVWKEVNGSKQWVLEDATVQLKPGDPTISKTVDADTDEGISTKKADNASIGDTVYFDLVAQIPQYPDSALAQDYSISDILSDGLTLNAASIQVYGINAGGTETLLAADGTNYTLTTAGAKLQDGTTSAAFTIDFNYPSIKGTYTKIHVAYNAVLNKDAILGIAGNPNTAYLEYKNNPYIEESGWKQKTDTATVYTYGLYISKVDADNKKALTGAVFELYASENGDNLSSNKIYFVWDSDGVYHKVAAGTEGAVTSLTVNSTSGQLTLNGLDAGTWHLKETKAPDGYNLLAGPVSVEIVDADLDGAVTVDEQEINTGLVPLTVENDDGFRLPVTGGMGTILFTAVGVVLMGAAVILLVIALKRKKAENK